MVLCSSNSILFVIGGSMWTVPWLKACIPAMRRLLLNGMLTHNRAVVELLVVVGWMDLAGALAVEGKEVVPTQEDPQLVGALVIDKEEPIVEHLLEEDGVA